MLSAGMLSGCTWKVERVRETDMRGAGYGRCARIELTLSTLAAAGG